MADNDLVDRLKQGVDVWNKWRSESLGPVDLTNADLSRADLRGAHLSGAHLSGASLSGADLTHADLSRAVLRGANLSDAHLRRADLSRAVLSGARLSGAHLRGAILSEAILTGAILTGANLFDAILSRADLTRANLTEVDLFETVFADVDLSNVIGLDTCDHYGPSIIDHRTLERSGSLPLSFLRGAGLPDKLIDYLPSLLGQAIQHYSCFISYSVKDQKFADRLYADLQNKGVRCWFAPHDMPTGAKLLDTIDEAIRLRDKVLLILSEHSIQSEWVEDEVKTAFEEERKRGQVMLFPIRLDDAVMDTKEAWAAKLRADRNIGDFRRWKDHDDYQNALTRALRDLTPNAKS